MRELNPWVRCAFGNVFQQLEWEELMHTQKLNFKIRGGVKTRPKIGPK